MRTGAHEGLLGQGALVADADLVHVLVVAPADKRACERRGTRSTVEGTGEEMEEERKSRVDWGLEKSRVDRAPTS